MVIEVEHSSHPRSRGGGVVSAPRATPPAPAPPPRECANPTPGLCMCSRAGECAGPYCPPGGGGGGGGGGAGGNATLQVAPSDAVGEVTTTTIAANGCVFVDAWSEHAKCQRNSARGLNHKGQLPSFLVAGVHKGGSTALYGYIVAHGEARAAGREGSSFPSSWSSPPPAPAPLPSQNTRTGRGG